MRRNWPFFKDSDWLILVFVHSAKPTAELENAAMSPSLSSPGLSYDTKFVHIGWELRSSLVGDTILGVQSEPACRPSVHLETEPYVVCPASFLSCIILPNVYIFSMQLRFGQTLLALRILCLLP